ncbi:MAG: Mov34/MPN/PAD-1 family protein [Planctomycetota bacterium]
MEIRIKGERGPRPIRRPPPGDRPYTAIVDPGVYHPPELPVFARRSVQTDMVRHAKSGGACEVGGFLLGCLCVHSGGRYLDIEVAVPALNARGAGISLTFDNEVLREFHHVHAQRYPDKLVLGWYHSHPHHSVFLSEHDTFIHRSFFNAEHHVAVVVDPYQPEYYDRVGVFLWEQGQISQGYHLIVYEADA